MNKIHVVDNKIIPFDNTDVILNNNIITFTNNGDYYLEYITSDNVNITININILSSSCHFFECSFFLCVLKFTFFSDSII